MFRANLMRKIALVACLALVATLFVVPVSFAAPPTWTKIAGNGITSTNNDGILPGVLINGKLTVGAVHQSGVPVTMYTYDTSFHPLFQPGFGDGFNQRLMPWALYGDSVYIGTQNPGTGGQLWKWSGTGDPVKLQDNGWGFGVQYDQVNPIVVYKNKLLVSVGRSAPPAVQGMRLYEFDGSTWTQVVGLGAAGTITAPGFGDDDNLSINGIEYSELDGKLILPVMNQTDGLQVYSYDGTTFTKIGEPGASSWPATQATGQVASSHIDKKLYLGTGNITGVGVAELWSYDGTSWAKMSLSGVLDQATNFFYQPFVRGADLYVAAWNFTGCRIYKREGSGFTVFSEKGFGNANNLAGLLATYNGMMFGETTDPTHTTYGEVYTTPIAPSIDELVPDSGPYGTVVDIKGHDFGVEQGSGGAASTVTFNGVQAEILSWSDLAIKAVFPFKAATGPVQVHTGRGDSNEVTFTLDLSKTWYFAEGTTRDNAVDGRYEEWLCLQNPGTTAANVKLHYMLADSTTTTQEVVVEPKSRKTVSVNDFLGKDKDVSTFVESDQLILAERPMYFNYRSKWTGGHDVIGVPVPRTSYYFAEGTTRGNSIDGYFEEWLCLQNPGATDATVNVKYLLETGQTVERNYPVKKTSRYTVDVNLEVGKDHDVSCVVTSDQPIVAERPMYFFYHDKWTGGHNVVGAPAPDTTFYFAEGTTRDNAQDGAFEEWICLQNATNNAVPVKITYFTDQAGTQTQDVSVGATSRLTVDVKLKLGTNVDTSFKIESTSGVPILVERPMYFNYHSAWNGGHDVMGCNNPRKSFYFAEGTTLPNFATWIAVMNPGSSNATVTFKYLLGDGTNKEASVVVGPEKRYTRNVLTDVGPNQDVSIVVEGSSEIVVERPMYFNYHDWCTGGSDTLGYGI
jgi:hypothetical protein